MAEVGDSILEQTAAPDISIRRQALSLCYTLCTEDSAEAIVEKLLPVLVKAEEAFQQELVLKMADEFVHQVTKRAAEYAKHRRSGTLDAVDVQLCLEKHWDIVVPGIPARTAPRPAALAAPYTYRRVDPRAPAPPLVAEDRPRKGSKRPRAS